MFTTRANDEELFETVKDLKVVASAEKSLRERKNLCDDDKEFIELSLIFMGYSPSRGVYFMGLDLMHLARWTSEVLYSLKI